jgi:hypothetical protein
VCTGTDKPSPPRKDWRGVEDDMKEGEAGKIASVASSALQVLTRDNDK